MNKKLMLCHQCLDTGLTLAIEAHEELYLDSLVDECKEVETAYTALIEAIERAKAGARDDIVREAKGEIGRVILYDFTGRAAIREM